MDLSSPVHRQVTVRVDVLPAVIDVEIEVFLKLFDADDPTRYEGPIDEDNDIVDPTDNRGIGAALAQTKIKADEIDEAVGHAVARTELTTTLNPGDNFRVVAAPRNPDFGIGGLDLLPIVSESHPETLGRLFSDSDHDNRFDVGTPPEPSDPILDENHPLTPVASSPLLTVWRRLHVEVDSMEAPSENLPFGPDDLLRGDIADPDTGLVPAAFFPAFIEVLVLDAAPDGPNQSDLPFVYAFDSEAALDAYIIGPNGNPDPENAARQTSNEDIMFWTVYVLGIYEYGGPELTAGPANNDPDDEFAILGLTTGPEPEYSLIPMEVIRDVAAQHGWDAATRQLVEQIVVLHEIGHQFELSHPPDNAADFPGHVMTVPEGDQEEDDSRLVQPQFRDFDIDIIRDHGNLFPKP